MTPGPSSRSRSVLVADRSATFRQTVQRALGNGGGWECDTAATVREARDKIVLRKPTVLAVEAEMPGNENGEFLRRLQKYYPIPVMVVARTPPGIVECEAVVLRAESDERTAEALAQALYAWGGSVKESRRQPASTRLIAIGASTGGTEAVERLLQMLPEDSPGILVAQHIPRNFSASFAARLNRVTPFAVREAAPGDTVRDGTVLVAPGDQHMRLARGRDHWEILLDLGPKIWHQRPSVDALFSSVAKHAGERATGIILTGMGQDGAAGLLEMRKAGSWTIAQNEASCVVFGMPRAAIESRAACEVVALDRIAAAIGKHRTVSSTNR